ncbi:MAG TPA: SDR family oxidoreductase [Candidatus Limnocylindrales bacterium]|nr:SDR family oxidoreductase [Candidatus Limnocylindrales bacterium]
MDWTRHPVVVVTGASAGVGRATVRELARRGASVGLIARGERGLAGARADVEALGRPALAVSADVADAAAVEAAAERIESELGPIDAWVNSAMVSVFSPIRETRAEEIKRVTDVTYLGTVSGTLSALRRMLPRDSGVIVQVGSALAYRSIPLQAAYCGAKHAVAGFTDSLRSELLHDQSNVRVSMVQLPALNTPQFEWSRSRMPRRAQPVPPIFQPELAARAICDQIDHPGREVFLGAPTILAIQAQKLVPGLLDRYLAKGGWEGQMTEEPADRAQPDNLFEPVDADQGAHGRFDAEAIDDRPLPAPIAHPVAYGAAASAGALAIGAVAWRLLRR